MSTTWPPPGTVPLALDVVSVQSQVIYGRVGNNVAMPTLAALGLTATAVPTVLLSNTPHYATLHGGPIPVDWFAGHLDDLRLRGALKQLRAVISGYLGSAAQAEVLANWIRELHTEHPGLQVVIDPVIGDHDHGIYVAPELVQVHKRRLRMLATGLTPNSFELSTLAGTSPDADLQATIAAARTLLGGNTEWIVVTSAAPAWAPTRQVQLAIVTPHASHLITHPQVNAGPKGTGDLFTASLSGYLVSGKPLLEAAQAACARVLRALHLTARARCAELLLPTDDDFSAERATISARSL